MARTLAAPPALGWAAVAMARPSQLEGRLRAILDSGVNRASPGRVWTWSAAVLAVALVAPLAAVRAQNTQEVRLPAAADVDSAIRAATSQKNPEMLEAAARAAARLRNYDVARTLLQSAAAIRAEVSGRDSAEYGTALMKLAQLEEKAHRSKAAEAAYADAVRALGERPEAAPALFYLGASALAKGEFALAGDHFQHAQRVDPGRAGAAAMWMAVARQQQGNRDQAAALYQSALALEAPGSSDAAATRNLYAAFLREAGRAEEASELEARNAAIQKASAAQPKSGASGPVYRSGGDVTPPSVLEKEEPEYSDEARAAKLVGTMLVSVEIGPDGRAQDVKVMQGLGLGLDENGIEAVRRWRFRPGLKDGQPVTVAATIEINWRLL